MTPRISVGIPTYNGAERVEWLLKSLSMRTPELASGEARIVLVDDGSPHVHETRAVAELWKDVLYIEHGHNRGISAGWNTASRAIDAEIVVLLNDDVIVSSDWLAPLVYALRHSPKVGVVGQSWHAFLREDVPQLLASESSDRDVIPRDPNKVQTPDRRVLYEDTNPGRVMCPTGQLFAFRRSDFDAVGGFDERMRSFFEESSFGTEMAARGMIGLQTTWPFCWHMWSETFRTNPELDPGSRMEQSRDVYRSRWAIPGDVPRGREFDFTNPKYLGAIGDVEVGWLSKTGPKRGVLRQDGAMIDVEDA
jgi:GT2 family glycosyltransferase